MLTLRLDNELENRIKVVAKNLRLSKSEFVRKSIVEYIKNTQQPSAWQLGQDLFGKHASENKHLSEDRKQLIKAKILAKR